VPSQTELLHYFGLEDEVVGLTKFCIHPEHWYRTKKRVGGTKQVKINEVAKLQPDLIIANKEENTLEDVAALRELAPVYVSDIRDLDDAQGMIEALGKLCGKAERAKDLNRSISSSFAALADAIDSEPPTKVLYLIWKDPIMAAGRDTFIQAMLDQAGLKNVLNTDDQRYPSLEREAIQGMQPDVLLLSSEPFPFKGKHSEEIAQWFPHIHIKEVDGEVFSWYGSRLLKTADYLLKLHRELRDLP
jgi:ABC-type Fe3+-hydroxamate transport system substrate-binding protein